MKPLIDLTITAPIEAAELWILNHCPEEEVEWLEDSEELEWNTNNLIVGGYDE